MKTMNEFKLMAAEGRSVKEKLHLAIMNNLVNNEENDIIIFRCSDQEGVLAELLLRRAGHHFNGHYDPFREGVKVFYIYTYSDTSKIV